MPKKGESDPVKEKFWRKQISDFEASTMTLIEFCRSRGLSDKNFGNWRKRLSQRNAAAQKVDDSKMSFAPVQMVEQEIGESTTKTGAAISIEVVLRSGIVLRIADDCSLKLLECTFSLLGVK